MAPKIGNINESTTETPRKPSLFNTDGWMNLFTGQGIAGRDKQVANNFAVGSLMTEQKASDLYRQEGFARRIVDLPSKEMVREWFDISGDTDGLINSDLLDLDLPKETLKAIRWADVYGGSLMVFLIDDGGTLEIPLNENKIKSIQEVRVYNRYQITWDSSDLENDPNLPRFGKPKFYHVNPIDSTSSGSFKVHYSRTLVFDGVEVSPSVRVENSGWGDSIYESCLRELENLGGALFSAKNIVDDFIQAVVSIDNLAELIASGKEKKVITRLNLMDMSKSTLNTILLDSKEQYEKKASSVSGLDKLLQVFAQGLSAVRGIPYTLLMGQSPAGLGATGDSDIRFWYDNVRAEQKARLLKNMERAVFLSMKASEGATKGKEIENWSIIFKPLWQATEKETAETRKLIAETDAIYIDKQVLDSAEVAVARFGGDEYSSELSIEESKVSERSMNIVAPEETPPKKTEE